MKKVLIITIIILTMTLNSYASLKPITYADAIIDSTGAWVKGADGSHMRLNKIANTRLKLVNPLKVKTAVEVTVKNGAKAYTRAAGATISEAAGCTLIAGLAVGGLYYLGGKWMDWLIAEGNKDIVMKNPSSNESYYKNAEDGKVWKKYYTSEPAGCDFSSAPPTIEVAYFGYFPQYYNYSDGLRDLMIAALELTGQETTSYQYGTCSVCGKNCKWMVAVRFPTQARPVGLKLYAYHRSCNFTDFKLNDRKATTTEMATAANYGIADDPDNWWDAVGDSLTNIDRLVNDMTDDVWDMDLEDPYSVHMPRLISEIGNALDDEDVTNIEDDIVNETDYETADDWINDYNNNQPQNINVDMTATNAKLDNISDKLGDDVEVPADPEIVLPTKLSLTTVMESFMTSISNLPIVAALQGLSINLSGATSMLCINLPANLGGQKCYDCASAGDAFASVGSALLALTSIMMFIWVFRG